MPYCSSQSFFLLFSTSNIHLSCFSDSFPDLCLCGMSHCVHSLAITFQSSSSSLCLIYSSYAVLSGNAASLRLHRKPEHRVTSLVHRLEISASLISAGHLPPSDPTSNIVICEVVLPRVQCVCGMRNEGNITHALTWAYKKKSFIWARIRWLPLEISLPTFWFGVSLIGILGEKQW